ncbi:MAG: undecaprenyl/decaprenyl-phosphate alpha-N-acetylglucosaminyl 1-phosphate transferase [Clostridiales bacterium]|nr:undecaprenyl/decaprenyl-phosphate alpha-N-acetylglucosaminyl 1-phosphate transferase [Candidatus Crickella merdequi]
MNIINSSNTLITVIGAFGLAAVIAFVMAPVSIKVAHKIGAIDIPKDERRMHKKPIPRFGGLAIFAGTMVSMGLFEGDNELIRVAMLGGVLMYLLGAVDDVKSLSAPVKFAGQMAIAILMYGMGIRIGFIANYFGPGTLNLGLGISFLITIFWIVGVTNAINLMDGLDGLAGGITAIIALFLAYVAYIHGDEMGMISVGISLMALAGGCAGFLPYNFNPAKTFMGDSGALFLGYMIAVMSVISPLKRATLVAALVPIMALAIPIFDTLFAIVRRIIRREHIMAPDKGHIHHRIMRTGFGQRRSVLIIYGVVGIMGMSAVLISRELYKDAIILAFIAAMYLSVILVEQKPREYESPSDWIRKAKPKTGESEWQKEE